MVFEEVLQLPWLPVFSYILLFEWLIIQFIQNNTYPGFSIAIFSSGNQPARIKNAYHVRTKQVDTRCNITLERVSLHQKLTEAVKRISF